MALQGCFVIVAAAGLLHAQGRGNSEWTTSGFDAQRSGWLRADARLTKEAVAKGEMTFLWKMPFENSSRQLNSLTPPVLLDRLIGYRGFKSLAFVGASGDRIFSIDTDLARPYWTAVLNYSAATAGQPAPTADCPGGLVAMPSRRTALAPAPPDGGGGAGRGGVRNGSAVGEPGKGAAVLSQMQPQRGGGRGTEGRGAPQGRGQGRGASGLGGRGGGFGGVEPLLAMGSDGYLRALYVSNGGEMEPPFPFVPPDAKPSSLIFVDGAVYTTTASGCGAVPNAVWMVDVSVPLADRKVRAWKTGGPDVVGASGLALGSDGTLFVALGKAPTGAPAPAHAESVVALDRETLQPKDWFTAPGAEFNATPIVIPHGERDLIAVTADDGRLYLLDAASLGGRDRRTPLAVSGRFGASGGGLATFEASGTRWILATAGGAGGDVKFAANGLAPTGRVVAFTLTDEGGRIGLTPGWRSRDLVSPLAPIVVGDIVFAVSGGEHRGGPASLSAAARAKRSVPAVLYALDGATGKTLWSSGTRITSFARAGLAAGGGQVYVVTNDNHLYAFGIPMEH
jgi:outer membrane protein assembly factor BamB